MQNPSSTNSNFKISSNLISSNPAEIRDTANFASLNNYTIPSFREKSLDAKLSMDKDQLNSIRFIEESENNILDDGLKVERDREYGSFNKTIKLSDNSNF